MTPAPTAATFAVLPDSAAAPHMPLPDFSALPDLIAGHARQQPDAPASIDR